MKQPLKKLYRSALPVAIGALMGRAFMASQSTILLHYPRVTTKALMAAVLCQKLFSIKKMLI